MTFCVHCFTIIILYKKLVGGTEFQNRFKKRRKHLLNLGSLEKDCLRTKHFRLALFRVTKMFGS